MIQIPADALERERTFGSRQRVPDRNPSCSSRRSGRGEGQLIQRGGRSPCHTILHNPLERSDLKRIKGAIQIYFADASTKALKPVKPLRRSVVPAASQMRVPAATLTATTLIAATAPPMRRPSQRPNAPLSIRTVTPDSNVI